MSTYRLVTNDGRELRSSEILESLCGFPGCLIQTWIDRQGWVSAPVHAPNGKFRINSAEFVRQLMSR
ncbi:hypothetical protein CCR95_07045 [Thiocystis minor]|nr:hypothetical protein [Thiocystis minor]